MRKFINQLLSARNHGKAAKCSRKNDHENALKYFQSALKYAMKADDQATAALEIECIARTHFRLGDYENAKKSAEESLKIYNTLGTGPAINNSVNRVNELLVLLAQGQGR